MGGLTLRPLLAPLAVVLVTIVGTSVEAGPNDSKPAAVDPAARREAQQHFRKGVELYDENDFRGALVEFERAYNLAPSYRILYNIAQVRYQLRDYAGALKAFEQYLADGGKQVDRRRRSEVEQEIVKLRGRVAQVTITTSVSGAEVFIDDVLVGTTPIAEPIVVSAGRRTVTATKQGYHPATRTVDVASADKLDVTLELVALRSSASPPPSQLPAPAPEARERPAQPEGPATGARHQVPWLAWGAAGVLAAGATVTGVMALGASNDLADKRGTPNVGRDSLDAARAKTSRMALVTDVLGGAALVVGGYAAWRTFFDDPVATERNAPASVHLSVVPAGVTLGGSF